MRLNQFRTIITVITITFLLVACGGGANFRVKMPKKAIPHVHSSNVLININQKKIYAQIKRSNITQYTGGGLIPALVDVAVETSRQSDADDALIPVNEVLNNYHFNQKIVNGLTDKLKKIAWLKLDSVSKSSATNDDEKLAERKKNAGNLVIDIQTSYYLGIDFRTLIIETVVIGYPNDSSLTKLAYDEVDNIDVNVLFRNKYTSRSYLFVPFGASLTDAGKLLASNNGEEIFKAMDTAIAEMLESLAVGLEAEGVFSQSLAHKQ